MGQGTALPNLVSQVLLDDLFSLSFQSCEGRHESSVLLAGDSHGDTGGSPPGQAADLAEGPPIGGPTCEAIMLWPLYHVMLILRGRSASHPGRGFPLGSGGTGALKCQSACTLQGMHLNTAQLV